MASLGQSEGSQGESGRAVSYSADWGIFARRVAAIALLIALALAVNLVTPVFTAVALAAILAFLLSYPTRALTRHTRLTYTPAAALVAAAYLVIATAALFAVVAPSIRFLGDLASKARTMLQDFIAFLTTYTPDQGVVTNPATGAAVANLNFILQPLSDLVRGGDASQLGSVVPQAASIVGGAALTVGGLIGILLAASVLAIAFLLEAPLALRSTFRSLRPDHRREIAILVAFVEGIWSDYFRATLVCGALMGALTTAQLLIMGIPGALVIGTFTAVVSVVPIIGGFIALVPIGIAPLVTGSTVLQTDRLTLTLLVVGVNLLIQLIMWNLLQPVILGQAVTLSASVVMLVVAIGTVLGGMLGAFIAVPIAAVAREVAKYLLRKIRGGDPYPGMSEPAFVAQWLADSSRPADDK